jgi:iron(III) transport system ATP-binding protein
VASVELKGLTKRYGEAVAVDDLSLTVEHGQLICLLGPSGCGKTTTLRLIAGFIEPSAGEISVGGRLLSSPSRTLPPEGRNMSMIFQSYALWPHMTVAENVAYGLKIRKLDRTAIESRLRTMLSTARLEALADRYPGELSGGQQQRVSLARALIVEPETLLLDEPLSNLDANLREEMRFEIRRLHDRYRYTTVYVTHDQVEAMTTADLIAVMNQGRIEQLATPEQIYDRPRSAFVARFIGGANILRGRVLDPGRVMVGGCPLRCEGAGLRAGQPISLAVRQHDIAICAAPPPPDSDNHLPARVTRHVFLGSSRDYTAILEDSTELRISAPAERAVAPGEQVWLHLPADRIRALVEDMA